MRTTSVAIALLSVATFPAALSSQALIRQPVYYQHPAHLRLDLRDNPALGAPEAPISAAGWLSELGLNAQFGQAELGAAAEVWRLDIYGKPRCHRDSTSTDESPKPDVCTPHIALSPTISSNIIDPITTTLSSIRDYLLSQSGAPLTGKLAFVQGTTKSGDVRQSWGAYQVFGTMRALPIAGASGGFAAAGAASLGGTGEFTIEFDATKITSQGTTVYPGSLYLSVSPMVVLPFGGEVRSAIFAGTHATVAVWGLDYRIGIRLTGSKPTSFSVVGTIAASGFKAAQSSVGVAASKSLGL